MRIGISLRDPAGPGPMTALREELQRAADDGFTSGWLNNIFGVDALTALAVAGSQVPGIEVGTAVVPTYPRHPAALAQQALTAAAAVDGHLVLGIGLSHKVVIEDMFGYDFSRPLRHMREYLAVLLPLLDGQPVSFAGETVRANIGLSLDDSTLGVVQLLAVVVAGIGAAYAFDFRPRRDPDFSWVVLTRMLVMMGVYMVQNFLQYYMQDVAGSKNPTGDTTLFIVILTVTALIASLIAGRASDRFGRKRMVYISGSFMAVVGAAFVLAPYLVPGHVLTLALGAAAIFGLGYGAYVSVDWALVADVLPSEATYARDMGVWNIGLTIPQVLAAIFGGALLALGAGLGSKQLGYSFLFVSFVVFCVLGTVTVRYIKGVKQ